MIVIYLETNSDGQKSQGYINSGKKEGIGAIAQYQLMLYAICKKFDVQFYSKGFENIGHSSYTNYSESEWSQSFTSFFNFSTNKEIKNKLYFDKIDDYFLSFVEKNRNSSENFLIYIEPENILQYGQSIVSEIFEKKYLLDVKNNFLFNEKLINDNFLNISFHIRNINLEDTSFQESREYYNKENIFKYVNLIRQLHQVCENEKVRLHLHSQGNYEHFEWINNEQEENFEIILHLNNHPVKDIFYMSFADLLIMSNSSFSWISHLLNYNVSLVRDNFWHSTYPNTIKLDENYFFNVKKLRIQ